MRLSEILKQYRSEHGLSQRRFAELCGGVTNGYVSMIENELNPSTGKKVIPSLEKLQSFSRGMGISLKELLEKADDIVVQDADDACPGERLLNYMTIFGDSIDDISGLLGMSNEDTNRVIAGDLELTSEQAMILGRRYGVKSDLFCDYDDGEKTKSVVIDGLSEAEIGFLTQFHLLPESTRAFALSSVEALLKAALQSSGTQGEEPETK